MNEIHFRAPCIPCAQPRQRHRSFMVGGKIISHNYTPKDSPVHTFKATIRHAATAAYSGPPIEGPISLEATFLFPRPGRLIFKRREMRRCWHSSRPDCENVGKALMDCLTGLIWRDDSQVAWLKLVKMYAAGDEQAGVEVYIRPLGVSSDSLFSSKSI